MTFITLPSDLVSVSWLSENINNESLILLDASWFMPALNRDGKAEWADETIPGAMYFDFDKSICDQGSALPHMMPSEAIFQQASSALGINQKSAIVAFDRLGIFSSPRVWWMFKSMGFNNIAVLDGGLNAWKEAGLAVSKGTENQVNSQGDFVAKYQSHLISNKQQVLSATTDAKVQILDARPEARFLGQVAEPRAELRSGHMPNAKNLPFNRLIENGKMRELSALTEIYKQLTDNNKNTVLSCGSGVTACVLALGATLCEYQNLSVYDGSWTEWGADESLPIIKSDQK